MWLLWALFTVKKNLKKIFKHSESELWSFLQGENGDNCTWTTIKKGGPPIILCLRKQGEMILNPEIICEYFPLELNLEERFLR